MNVFITNKKKILFQFMETKWKELLLNLFIKEIRIPLLILFLEKYLLNASGERGVQSWNWLVRKTVSVWDQQI